MRFHPEAAEQVCGKAGDLGEEIQKTNLSDKPGNPSVQYQRLSRSDTPTLPLIQVPRIKGPVGMTNTAMSRI